MPPYCSSTVIQASWSLGVPSCFECERRSAVTFSFCWSHLRPHMSLRRLQHAFTWTRHLLQELQVTVNSKAKNMASVTFFRTTWPVKDSGNITSDEQYGGILWICYVFLTFESKSQFTSVGWEITEMPFSCETPAEFCELKNLCWTLCQHESEKIISQFSFFVNYAFD